MYAAAVEDLDAEGRRRFDEALAPARPMPAPRRLAAVRELDPARVSEERLAAIAALGGDVVEA